MEKHTVKHGALRMTWAINPAHGRDSDSKNVPGRMDSVRHPQGVFADLGIILYFSSFDVSKETTPSSSFTRIL